MIFTALMNLALSVTRILKNLKPDIANFNTGNNEKQANVRSSRVFVSNQCYDTELRNIIIVLITVLETYEL